ncbi:MAG: metallophosphoesterase [bacterium]
MKLILKLIKIIIFLMIVAIIWGRFIEPNKLVVTHKDLVLPNWSHRLDNLKVVAISDMHIGTPTINEEKLVEIVQLANAQKPDLIFLLGDMDALAIKASKINTNKISRILSGFHSKYGVVAVMGNHDYDTNIIRTIIKNAHIPLLENESLVLKSKGLNIVGVEDFWMGHPDYRKATRYIKKSRPTILLSHNPDYFPLVPKSVSLTLSGHTHGGHINLPYLGGLFIISDYGQRFMKGHIAENGKQLFVSSGIGGVPVRIGNPPEIVVLTLHSDDNGHHLIVNTPQNKGVDYSYVPMLLKIRHNDTLRQFVRKYIK